MRSFEERRAQIFERSEKRIKARKRMKNSIIAGCATLCIAVTVCSVVLLPQMRHKIAPDANSSDESFDMMASLTGFKSATLIINSEHGDITKTVTENANAVYDTVFNAFEDINTGAGEAIRDEADTPMVDNAGKEQYTGGGTKGENYSAENSITKVDYTIRFTSFDNTKTVFEIKDKKLLNKSSGEEIALSKAQFDELMSFFK